MSVTGSVVRAWRRGAGWDVPEAARRLRHAAADTGETVPGQDSLLRMIRRWEREDSTVSERYELLFRKALGQITSSEIQSQDSLSAVAIADLTTVRRDLRSERARTRDGLALVRAAEEAAFGVSVLNPDVLRTGPVSETDAAGIETATAMFRAWDNAKGGGLRRAAVIGQLADISSILDGPFESAQAARRCYSAVADLAQLAGWMTWDLQLHATAQRYYLLALRLARDAGDRSQVARMMYCLSRQMIDLGRPVEALELAAAGAYSIHRQAAPKTTALLAIAHARAYACLGAENDCRAALGAAQDAYNRDGHDPAWCGFFDDTEFAGLTGVALRDLALAAPGQGSRIAVEARGWIQQAADARPASFLRSKILDTDGIAVVSLLSGEPDRAASAMSEAIKLTARLRSPRTVNKVRSTIAIGARDYPRSAPWDDLTGRAKALTAGPVT